MIGFRETKEERLAIVALKKKLGCRTISDIVRKCIRDCARRHKIEVEA